MIIRYRQSAAAALQINLAAPQNEGTHNAKRARGRNALPGVSRACREASAFTGPTSEEIGSPSYEAGGLSSRNAASQALSRLSDMRGQRGLDRLKRWGRGAADQLVQRAALIKKPALFRAAVGIGQQFGENLGQTRLQE